VTLQGNDPAPMDRLSLAAPMALRAVSCGLFISSGKGTHPDRVLDSYELIVVRKGTLSLWEEEARFDVPPGHALLLHAGRRHRGAAPFARNLSFYWMHFVPLKVWPKFDVGGLGADAGDTGLEVPQFSKVRRPDCVAELFHRYLDDQEARRLDPLYSSLLMLQILWEVSRTASDTRERGAVLMGRAEAFVTHHLAEKLSTAGIARALRINPDYLNRVCRSVHKMTMTEYLHRRRLTDAAAMLRETAETVTEVAAACGYPSVRHFRRTFERYRGLSPGAYRRLMARAYVNAR
jgi:AraC-like DNA-binding protein